MNDLDRVKLYGMSIQLAERELDEVERALKADLQRAPNKRGDRDEEFYPQFDESVRREASGMAQHYEIFYCLEKATRSLISAKLESAHGAAWWTIKAPQTVRDNASKNMQREMEAGISQRSEDPIDYTTFGELGDIVRANWTDFSDTFNSEKAFNKIMGNLNLLRGPIAHCSPFAPDEVVRLRLTLRDWFRLME
jgi:hypothetical protein